MNDTYPTQNQNQFHLLIGTTKFYNINGTYYKILIDIVNHQKPLMVISHLTY